MPELAALQKAGIQAPQFQPLHGYIERNTNPAPEVDTRAASAIAGKSALYGSIAKVLSELPEKIREAYKEGRKLSTGSAVEDKFNSALQENDTKALADFKATGEGAVSYQPIDNDLRQAQLDSYGRRATHTPAPVRQPLYDSFLKEFGDTAAVSPNSAAAPVASGNPDEFTASATAYWPGPKESADEHGLSGTMEGGTLDRFGNPIWGRTTMEDFQEGKGNYVTVAMDGAYANGQYLKSPDFPGVVFRVADTGDAFKGKGTSAVDIAFRDPEKAKSFKQNVRFSPIGKPTADIAAPSATDPEAEAQIANAAAQLQNLPLSGLSAENVSGPIAPADIKPLSGFPEFTEENIVRPTGRFYNRNSKVGVISTPDKTIQVHPGDKTITTDIPKAAVAIKKEGRVYPSIEAIKADKIDPAGAIVNPDGTYTVKQFKPLIREEKAKRLTEGEQKSSMYVTRAEAANVNLEDVLKSYDPTTFSGAAGIMATGNKVTNFLAPADAQRMKQAADEFATAILRKDTGAAIQKFERDEVQRTYIPQPGDSEAVIKQKAEARHRAIEALRHTLPNADQAASATGEVGGSISGTTGMVRIKAPDGTIKPVRADAAQKYIDKGGVVVE